MLTSGAFGYPFDYLLFSAIYISLLIHALCFFKFFPRKRHPRLGLMLGNTFVFICLLGTAAWAAETYLRFAYVATDSFGVSLPARRWFALHTSLNSLGCRDKEWSVPKPPGVRRIAFVGDSLTYGWGVKNVRDRFTERIQTSFDAKSPGAVEVMNVAKPGWNTDDEIQPIKDMVDVFGADEIVLCHVLNDIEDLIPTTAGFNPTRPPEPKLFNPDSSSLLDYLYRRVWVPRSPTVAGYLQWLSSGYSDAEVWGPQMARLESIIDECHKRNAKLRVVLLPLLQLTAKSSDLVTANNRLREFFHSKGVEVIDLSHALDGQAIGELVVNSMDAHPNAKAHDLLAKGIWRGFFSQ